MMVGGGEGECSKNRRGINVEKVKKEEGMVVEKRKPQIGRCVRTSGVWASGSEWQGAWSVQRPDFRLNA